MQDAFISYSRKNKDIARKIFELLEGRGRDTWIDWDDIPYSVDWMEEIKTGIDSAYVFVFIISPDSLQSRVCNVELDHALKHGKRIVPIIYQDVMANDKQAQIQATWLEQDWEIIAKKNWEFLQSRNWIVLPNHETLTDAVQAIIDTIEIDPIHIKAHTEYLVSARKWADSGQESSLLLSGSELSRAKFWFDFHQDKQPFPTQLHREFLDASLQRQEQLKAIDAYEKTRNEAIRQYVTPYLRQRIVELNQLINKEQERIRNGAFVRQSALANDYRYEIEVIRNFLGQGGRWHPQPAIHIQTTDASNDYQEVYRFPCCQKIALSERQPSQFSSEGCQSVPKRNG